MTTDQNRSTTQLWNGVDRAQFEGITSIERYRSIGINLYELDDGRWWLDDVYNDRQGFVSIGQANVIRRLLGRDGRAHGYEAEPLTSLLEEYRGNTARPMQTFVGPYVPDRPLSPFVGKFRRLPADPVAVSQTVRP